MMSHSYNHSQYSKQDMTMTHLYSAQVWHVLVRDHTVLPETHECISTWNEPYLAHSIAHCGDCSLAVLQIAGINLAAGITG